ncbi:hypothetical protein BKA69DRAFT_1123747 [Paraphysoderma sedebokerense]|nr:hypothetical protein BKA69DRAFT_1123747 [Paraphysoderma sedebokerense]
MVSTPSVEYIFNNLESNLSPFTPDWVFENPDVCSSQFYENDAFRIKFVVLLDLVQISLHGFCSVIQYFSNSEHAAPQFQMFLSRIFFFALSTIVFRNTSWRIKALPKFRLWLNPFLATLTCQNFFLAGQTSFGATVPISYILVGGDFSAIELFFISIFYAHLFYISVGATLAIRTSDLVYPVLDSLLAIALFRFVLVFDQQQLSRNRVLQAALDQAQETANRQKAFYAVISHELRTPLHGILNSLELLRETSPSSDQKIFITVIESCAENLSSVINHVLQHSRLHAEAYAKPPSTFHLCSIIQGVAETVESQADRKGLHFVVDTATVDVSLYWVKGDVDGLKQSLVNLVGNAVKYTQKGFVKLHLKVSRPLPLSAVPAATLKKANPDEPYLIPCVFTVKDTGIGMSAEFAQHCFDPYAQEDNQLSRQYAGTGLGLSIVKSWVDLLGGEIFLDTVKGRGTIVGFRLWLPPGEMQTKEEPVAEYFDDKRFVALQPLTFVKNYLTCDRYEVAGVSYNFDVTKSESLFIDGLVRRLFQNGISIAFFDPKTFDPIPPEAVPPSCIMKSKQISHEISSAFDYLLIDANVSQLKEAMKWAKADQIGIKKIVMLTSISLYSKCYKAIYDVVKENYADWNGRIAVIKKPIIMETFLGHLKTDWDAHAVLISSQDLTVKEVEFKQNAVLSRHRIKEVNPGIPLSSISTTEDSDCDSNDSELVDHNTSLYRLRQFKEDYKILIAEDNEINRTLLQKFLQMTNWPFEVAVDGREAVEKFEAGIEREDRLLHGIVLMDIQMPGMDGVEAIQKIRQIEEHHQLERKAYIVAISGLAIAGEELCERIGCQLYLTKPINLKMLNGVLENAVRDILH